MRYGLTHYPRRRAHKFNAVKTKFDGETYDSALESRYAMLLADQRKWGEIRGFERQIRYRLEVNGVLIATHVVDFRVTLKDGKQELHEVKGYWTPEYRMKRRLMRALYPEIPYRVFGRDLIEIPAD